MTHDICYKVAAIVGIGADGSVRFGAAARWVDNERFVFGDVSLDEVAAAATIQFIDAAGALLAAVPRRAVLAGIEGNE